MREILVKLPAVRQANEGLAGLRARAEVEDLTAEDYLGMQRGRPCADLRERIMQLGLDFRLMTPFTSLRAVEETVIIAGGKPRRIEVPVEVPEGVGYEGILGDAGVLARGVGLGGSVAAGLVSGARGAGALA